MKSRIKTALCAGASLLIGVIAWQWYWQHFPSWDEEVLLTDGRIASVHRATKFNTEGSLLETALTIDLPEIGGKRIWREALYPAIVNSFEGKVYVVGFVTYRSSRKYRNPRFGYVAFVYANSGWQRIPFLSVPESVRSQENIAFCPEAAPIRTWRDKQTGWCDLQGNFVLGAQRKVDLVANERNAKNLAELFRSSIQSD